ncbi:MAG: thiol-disulfide oxidoreductase DCC family protein [Saprospiraceae bacterium]
MENHPIILFDGVCNLCNGAVQFIIERDKKRLFRFASLQSDIGKQYQAKAGLSTDSIDTILLVEDGQIYQKSSAALRIARKLDGLWSLLFIFIIVPPFIRNRVYDFIARNRYRWFGKQDSCWLPTPDLKVLFLD